MVPLQEETDSGGHHSREVSDTVEIDDVGFCVRVDCVEEEIGRSLS